jgi:hypothetical protein
MTQPLIRDRQYGLVHAQKRLQEAYEGKTVDLVKDIFSHATIELPRGFDYTFLRNGDLVAVISTSQAHPIVQRLALWSLLKRREVWNLAQLPHSINSKKCKLSSSGIVLLSPSTKTSDPHLLVCNRQVTELPLHKWESLHLIGARIFSSWSQKHPEHHGLVTFFGELDCDTGLFKWAKSCLHPIQGEAYPVYAYNDEFWVRLSVTNRPRIEVMNLTNCSFCVTEFPVDESTEFSVDELAFCSACIVQNLLIYGTNHLSELCELTKPSINIFDLVKGVVIAEYPTNGKAALPKNLTANGHFVVWSEYLNAEEAEVKCFNLSTQKIWVVTTIDQRLRNFTMNLHLSGSLLIVSYYQRERTFEYWWYREVIELITDTTVQKIKYTGPNGGTCSFDNGIFFLADTQNGQTKMYIESFIQDFNTQEESPYRV